MAVLRKIPLEDVIVPFSDADDHEDPLMFAFFGGVYTAEILRGGIQSIRGARSRRPRHWG